ncbi:MAG: hypothetical protein IJL32_14895 [Oscillospiraceae bacterium]|nr:hypothetical protein [Oscillospiraceae bacterium]
MKCPFCGKEMQQGVLSGHDRSQITWKAGEQSASLFDRMMGNGKLTAAKYGLASFSIEAYYCDDCKKMILDTDIQKF